MCRSRMHTTDGDIFLKASRERPKTCKSPLLDLLHPAFSPGTLCLQYLRWVGQGMAPRLRLVFYTERCASFGEYVALKEKEGLMVISMARATSACIFRRVMCELNRRPLNAFAMLDGRRAEDVRMDIATELVSEPDHCRGRFWTRLLSSDLDGIEGSVVEPIRLFSQSWQNVLVGMLRLLDESLSIAVLERRNKRTKVILHKNEMLVSTLVAKSINQELQSNYEGRNEMREQQQGQRPLQAVLDQPGPSVPPKPKRGLGPRECFQLLELEGEATVGGRKNLLPFSPPWRAEVSRKFNALTEEAREPYKIMSESSKQNSKLERRLWKAGVKERSLLALADAPGVELLPLEDDACYAIVAPEYTTSSCRLCCASPFKPSPNEWHLPPPLVDGLQSMAADSLAVANLVRHEANILQRGQELAPLELPGDAGDRRGDELDDDVALPLACQAYLNN